MPFEGRSLSNLFSSTEQNSESLLIEKENLLCVFKLVIKDLLNSSLRHERILEKEYFPLKHFFIVFEHILLHGYNGKKSFPISSASNRKDLWPIIDLISRKSTDTQSAEISVSSKEMTNIRTSLGRVRAWLRLALMQKRLSDYFRVLIEHKQELAEFYDTGALLLSDENVIITGLLVGLNVLDFNFCLKETVLDHPIESTIHYSLYLRERRVSTHAGSNVHPPGSLHDPMDELDDYSSISSSPSTRTSVQNDDPVLIANPNDVISLDSNNTDSSYDHRMANILDQKNYLEEINRNLQRNVTSLQERLQAVEQANKGLLDETTEQKARLEQLEETVAKLTSEREQHQSIYQRKIDTLNADIEVERETYRKSRSGLDTIYHELQKKYEDERDSKEKIANVYQTQLSQNSEFLESTKLMEKDIETKTTLYDQLQKENRQLLEKIQMDHALLEGKERQVQSMAKENQLLRTTIDELETNIEQAAKERHTLGDTNDSLSRALAKADSDKSTIQTDLRAQQDIQQRLHKALTNEKDKVSSMQFDIHELKIAKQEYETYRKDMTRKEMEFERRLKEQDETIEELALKLEVSITREDAFREKDGIRASKWVKDEDVKECCQCKKEFNALKRKHHCRHCGQIYCEACASTKLSLPSSSKPVRVCDPCCKHFLAECIVHP